MKTRTDAGCCRRWAWLHQAGPTKFTGWEQTTGGGDQRKNAQPMGTGPGLGLGGASLELVYQVAWLQGLWGFYFLGPSLAAWLGSRGGPQQG